MTKDFKDNEFSILHLNIRSVVNKFDDLKAYLNSLEYKFSIIELSETWLNPDNINESPLTDYHNIVKVRTNKQGGGVGLYVNRSLQFRERTDLALNVEDVIESHFIELTTKPSNTLIGIIYRPPNNKLDLFKEYLCELLRTLPRSLGFSGQRTTLRQTVESFVFNHLAHFVFTRYNSCARATLNTW